jgi:hypothetical protein
MSDAGTETSDSGAARPGESAVGDPAEADEAAELPVGEVAESGIESAESSTDSETESTDPDIEPSDFGVEPVESKVESSDPSDAFEALGNEVRMAVLRALANADRETERNDGDEPSSGRTMTFSELFEVSPVDTSAGFAYHLRQLTGQFVEKTGDEDDQYALTYAGSQVARAIVAGTYTDRVSFDPVPTGDSCPLCESGDLAAACEANYVTVACTDCDRAILTLPLPPGAHRNRNADAHDDSDASPGSDPDSDPERLLATFDRHHRHRLSVMSDGVCPECAATMDATIARPPESVTERLPDEEAERAQVRLDCQQCGCRLHCPVTLAVLEHPAVVAFYHDNGENVRDRPIWNVGPEWRETVVSDDPWCVRVSTRLDEEVLDLFVAGDCSVAATRRRTVDEVRQAS